MTFITVRKRLHITSILLWGQGHKYIGFSTERAWRNTFGMTGLGPLFWRIK